MENGDDFEKELWTSRIREEEDIVCPRLRGTFSQSRLKRSAVITIVAG